MTNADKKIALVTGANKGIGLDIVRQLAQAGMFVYLGARDKQRGEQATSILSSEGLSVAQLVLDVTDAASITAAMSVIEQEHGKLDVLVNNAGIADGIRLEQKTERDALN